MNKNNQQLEGFFYDQRHAFTLYSAKAILGLIDKNFASVKSIVDLGCGVGTWLFCATENGASKCVGVEGPWLNEVTDLPIPRDWIQIQDLEHKWTLDEGFDLAISLEVAEHLSPTAGKRLVLNLTKASKLVLFSAAIPDQGGHGHINEQWPEYWQAIFAEQGYRALDCIRPVIQSDIKIPFWYRQNILIFAHEQVAAAYYTRLSQQSAVSDPSVIRFVEQRISGVTKPSTGSDSINPWSKLRKIYRRIKAS